MSYRKTSTKKKKQKKNKSFIKEGLSIYLLYTRMFSVTPNTAMIIFLCFLFCIGIVMFMALKK